LLAALPAMALDPSRAITQYGFSSWDGEDGLPPNAVTAIAQTPDGYLWFGTSAGLGRFDGARFTIFDRYNTPALAKTRHIGALLPTFDGSLWIGRGEGLARFKNGKFIEYPPEQMSDAFIWSLSAGTDGSVYVGTYAGGLNRLKDGRFTVAIPSDGSVTGAVWATRVTRDGAIWTGTNGRGLHRWRNGEPTMFTKRNGLANDIVWAIHEDRRGDLWIGTNAGLNRLHDGQLTTFTTADGLSSNCIKAILEDRDGNLWIGTEGGGLNRYANGKIHFARRRARSVRRHRALAFRRSRRKPLDRHRGGRESASRRQDHQHHQARRTGERCRFCVREARDGSLLIGTAAGFSRWKNGKAENVSPSDGLSSNVVRSILEDPDGSVWLATNDGLNHYDHGKVTVYRVADGLPHDMVRTVTRDRAGNLWIGTRGGGLAKYAGGKFTVYDKKSGALPHNVLSSVDEDADGSLWIATNGGLTVLKAGVFRTYDRQSGLSNAQVRMTYHDRDGTHWIGTFSGGLNRMKNGVITPIRAANGLYDDVVYSIVEDDDGFLWMTGMRGIFRVSKKELNDFADGKIAAIHSDAITAADGMKNGECTAGLPASWKSRDGRLYFPTSRGVVIVDPKKKRRFVTPLVRIDEVVINSQRVDLYAGPVIVQPKHRNLEIRYTAVTFIAPKKISFRYRLRGFSDEWVEAGDRRRVFYTNLGPGQYTFEALASRGDGVWTAAQNPIRFELQAAFYETWWFAAACIVVLVLAIGAGFRMRLRYLQRSERLLLQCVDERTAQLRDANAHKQLILESAGEGIFGLDTNGIVTFINPAAARTLGWPMEEIVGRNLHEIVHAANESCFLCDATTRFIVAGELTTQFRERSGRAFPVECTVGTIVGAGGTESGVVVTFRDISERMAIERLKQEFVSTVSHELRTPLTAIRGALGLLGSGRLGNLAERGQRMLHVAIANTDRLTRLIGDILDLERIDSGAMKLTIDSLEIDDLIEEASDGVQAMAEQAGVTIVRVPSDAVVHVDHDRIIQVVTNLLSNAIKFSQPGSVVTVSGTQHDEVFMISVEDRGRGVPADQFETIFERFKQVDASDSRQKGGTGLGLAICRSIVELHGGRIWVESREGAGSVFRFTVPADRNARVA